MPEEVDLLCGTCFDVDPNEVFAFDYRDWAVFVALVCSAIGPH
jgi:hypothetical protein